MTTSAPVIRLTHSIMLCGPDNQPGRSIKTDAMLSLSYENVSENSSLGIMPVIAMHTKIHRIVIKAVINNNIMHGQ